MSAPNKVRHPTMDDVQLVGQEGVTTVDPTVLNVPFHPLAATPPW